MVKDIEKMTREELINNLLSVKNLLNEAGQKIIKQDEMISELTATTKFQETIILKKDETIKHLEELTKLYRLEKYGKVLKQVEASNIVQLSLFDLDDEEKEVESIDDENATVVVKSHVRKVNTKTSHIDYSNLEHIEVDETPSEDVKCDLCGNKMVVYKYITKEELDYIPSQIKVIVHKIPCYRCDNCTDEEGKSLYSNQKAKWKPLIDRSLASSSLVASLIDYKYNQGLPFYAMEQLYESQGITIPRDNMCNWMKYILKYIDPLYEIMSEDLLTKKVILGDETTMYVLNEEGKAARSNSYLWQFQTSPYEIEKITIFKYKDSRRKEVVEEYLKDFTGVVVSDKYQGYSNIKGITNCYCHAHAFREIRKAFDLLPLKSNQNSLEKVALDKYKKVFDMDNFIREKAIKSYPESKEMQLKYIKENRNETLRLFDSFSSWLKEIQPKVIMKIQFSKAINYILSSIDEFRNFIIDPLIPLTNNSTESNFRKWVVNRKRCKFYTSAKGGEAASKIYSLLTCAIVNGYSVFAYFEYLFDNIRYEDLSDKEALRKYLPYKKELPDYCITRSDKQLKKKIKELEDLTNSKKD